MRTLTRAREPWTLPAFDCHYYDEATSRTKAAAGRTGLCTDDGQTQPPCGPGGPSQHPYYTVVCVGYDGTNLDFRPNSELQPFYKENDGVIIERLESYPIEAYRVRWTMSGYKIFNQAHLHRKHLSISSGIDLSALPLKCTTSIISTAKSSTSYSAKIDDHPRLQYIFQIDDMAKIDWRFSPSISLNGRRVRIDSPLDPICLTYRVTIDEPLKPITIETTTPHYIQAWHLSYYSIHLINLYVWRRSKQEGLTILQFH